MGLSSFRHQTDIHPRFEVARIFGRCHGVQIVGHRSLINQKHMDYGSELQYTTRDVTTVNVIGAVTEWGEYGTAV